MTRAILGDKMSVTPEIERVQFPDPYVYALVGSGVIKQQVYYLSIEGSGGYTGFVERIACDWFEGSSPPTTRSTLYLDIDGFIRTYEYQIQINQPYVFDPPLVATKWIRWLVTNNDVPYIATDGTAKNGSHYYGILIDGFLAKPKIHSDLRNLSN
jgi:hypothetical protein